jgi:hypothetical protein
VAFDLDHVDPNGSYTELDQSAVSSQLASSSYESSSNDSEEIDIEKLLVVASSR